MGKGGIASVSGGYVGDVVRPVAPVGDPARPLAHSTCVSRGRAGYQIPVCGRETRRKGGGICSCLTHDRRWRDEARHGVALQQPSLAVLRHRISESRRWWGMRFLTRLRGVEVPCALCAVEGRAVRDALTDRRGAEASVSRLSVGDASRGACCHSNNSGRDRSRE